MVSTDSSAATSSSPLGTFMGLSGSLALLQGPMLGASGHSQPSSIAAVLHVFIFDGNGVLPNLAVQDPLVHVLQQRICGVDAEVC